MTYYNEYCELINKRLAEPLSESTLSDMHHIKPKSIYPQLEHEPGNLVRLTLYEHIKAHYLLFMHYEYELKNSAWSKKMKGAIQLMIGKHKVNLEHQSLESIAAMYEKVRRSSPKGYLSLDSNGIYEANWKYNRILHRKKTMTNDIIKAQRIMMRWIDQTLNGQKLSRAYKDLKPCKQHGHLMIKGSKNEWYGKWCVKGKIYMRNTKTTDKAEAQKILDKWIIDTLSQKFVVGRQINHTGCLLKRIRKDGSFRWYARWMVDGKKYHRATNTDNYDEARKLLDKWISDTLAGEYTYGNVGKSSTYE